MIRMQCPTTLVYPFYPSCEILSNDRADLRRYARPTQAQKRGYYPDSFETCPLALRRCGSRLRSYSSTLLLFLLQCVFLALALTTSEAFCS
jgi:hypothetical protein